MRALFRIWAVFAVVLKRLVAQPGLALATMLGLVAAVSLTMSVPLYADAVYYRTLRAELAQSSEEVPGQGPRPPFAFMFRYVGAWNEPVEWEDVVLVDQYLTQAAGNDLGLPQKLLTRYVKTDNLQLFPQEDIAYADVKRPLAWVALGFISDLEAHITLVEGTFPAVAEPSQDSTLDVLVSEAMATDLGLQPGEVYVVFARSAGERRHTTQIPVRVAGIWKATDPAEEFWFYNPSALDDQLLVPEESFLGRISPYMEREVYLALWYMVMDGSDIHADDVGSLVRRIMTVQQRVNSLLPNTRLDLSPMQALQKYQRASNILTVLLFAFSIPILGLLLAFVGLVVGLTVERQRNEIAVLRSRGATALQVVGIAALQALLLGGVALAAGTPLGEGIAQAIGRARSFLNFTAEASLRVGVTLPALRFGMAAMILAMVAQLLPTAEAARHTVVSYKQERARALRRPWWQRAWLDFLLLIPAGYGVYLLRQQGSIALPIAGGYYVNDPFQNPLLFLVPALLIFALSLIILRILPVLMTGFAWLASHVGGVGTLLAARYLSRTPGFYSVPLVLLVFTLSLSAFTASLAQTLDNHLYDQSYYRVGADLRVVELGESTETPSGFGMMGGGESTEASAQEKEEGPRWLFLPVSEHLKVPGVKAAARIGHFSATTNLSGGNQQGTFIGIDRIDFPKVAFWRSDFAPATLGTLMNALALVPNGVLVSRACLADHALQVGDTIRIMVDTYGQRNQLDMKIVGWVDLFPTWYPDEGYLFVGNLEYLFEQAGGQFPYDVWLKTDPDVDFEALIEGINALRLRVVDWDAALERVNKEQQRPERQGLFGLLSVGFAAAALLTVLGFLLYALFSFHRRAVELSMLRAIGLSVGQMTGLLAWELIFLISTGLVAGTLLGAWVSALFIPYLQVGTDATARVPPFVVEIAWPAIFRIYALCGLLFVVALLILAVLLVRMKIFEAVKMGEAI